MRYNILSVTVLTFTLLTLGCSSLQKIVYRPEINQGNYLEQVDVEKIQKGMTKQQVIYLLGTPMLQDPFGTDTWFYIFRQQPAGGKITQQTLTLAFDQTDTLVDIKNEIPIKVKPQK